MTTLPAPNPWTRRAVVATIMVAGVLLGLGLLLFTVWTYIDPVAAGVEPIPQERAYALFLVQVVTGVAGIVLTPFALRHSAAEADPLGTASGPRSALICGLLVIALGMFSPLGAPLAVVVLVSHCSRRSIAWPVAAVVTYVVGAFVAELLGVDGDPGFAWGYLALSLVIPVIALLIGMIRRRRRENRQRVLAQARMTEAESAAREDRARIAERTRIARDMHDSLSHRLSLIAMHAGALEYRAETDPEDVRESAATIRESAHAAAADLRAVLSVLREEQENTAPRLDLEELAAEARRAGTPVDITWEAPLSPADHSRAPTLIAHTLYRIVQEGLTNARKHAPGAPVRVTISPARRAVVLRVSNPRPADPAVGTPPGGTEARVPGSGLGLVGLDERVRLVGGTLEVRPAAPGHDEHIITATLPWETGDRRA